MKCSDVEMLRRADDFMETALISENTCFPLEKQAIILYNSNVNLYLYQSRSITGAR